MARVLVSNPALTGSILPSISLHGGLYTLPQRRRFATTTRVRLSLHHLHSSESLLYTPADAASSPAFSSGDAAVWKIGRWFGFISDAIEVMLKVESTLAMQPKIRDIQERYAGNQDVHPLLGWHDAACYLVLPAVLLVVSQYVSMELVKPLQTQENSLLLLKFLHLTIGYLPLFVPSGLSVYWFANNVLSTAQQVWLRGAKPAVSENANSIITTGRAKCLEPAPELVYADSFPSSSSASTAAVSLPPPKPPPPPHHRHDDEDDEDGEDNNNEKDDFQEKALFLDSIGIDSIGVLSRDPSALASTSLPELKRLCGYLSSLGLTPSDLQRMASMCPSVLSLRLRDAASVCSFLIREAGVVPLDLRRVLHRRPRLLVSPVSSRLRPTLYFLQSLGIHDVTAHTNLLSCSVEDKFLPRIDYIQKLGFSYRDSVSMFCRFPPLFCYSINHNFEPKFNYFVVEMGRELKELREFPQYFSFSLDKRIKPRHQMCIQKGVYFPLNVMLKTKEQEFRRRLGVCVDSSLPLRDSPLWYTNLSCDDNTTTTTTLDDNIL